MAAMDEDAVRLLLMTVNDQLTPFIEAAEGQRAALVQRGWSASAAEGIAAEMLRGLIHGLFYR